MCVVCGMWEIGCARRSGEEDGEGVEGRGLGRFDSSGTVSIQVGVNDERNSLPKFWKTLKSIGS